MTKRRERWVQVLLAAMLLLCYAYYLPRRVDWNQNGRLDQVLAIVDQGTFVIDAYVGNTGDYAHFGEHYYSDKAPGVSFLGVPFYALFRTLARTPLIGDAMRAVAAGAAPGPASNQELEGLFPWRGYFALALYATTLGAVAIPSVILALLVYRLARRLGNSAGWAATLTLLYGLGTIAFPYGSAFYGHMLAAACLFGAFYLVYDRKADGAPLGAGRLFAAGFLLGYAIITEYPMALPVAVIAIYIITQVWERAGGARNLARLLWPIAGGLIPIALLAIYDMAIYGTLLPAGYAYSEQWQTEVHTGFMTLTTPSLARLWGITFSSYRGLFFFSPFLLFALPGFLVLWRRQGGRALGAMSAGVVAILFLFNASTVVWWGGAAVGPRYVAPAVPFLMIPIGAWLAQARKMRLIFLIAGVVSLIFIWMQTITSIKMYPPQNFRSPFVDYALPRLLRGEFALNLGNALGLQGWWSQAPLALGMAALAAGLAWLVCKQEPRYA